MYKEILIKMVNDIHEETAEKIIMNIFSTNKPTSEASSEAPSKVPSEPSEPQFTDRNFEYASEAREWLEIIGFKSLSHTQFYRGTVTAKITSSGHHSYDVKFTY